MADKFVNDSNLSRLWSKIKTALNNKLDSTANAVSASKLQTGRTIDGVTFDGSDGINHYFTCSTAAATAAKAANAVDPTKTFVLATGAKVIVKFTYANSAASPTLTVNAKGPKPIYWNGAALASAQYWAAGAVLAFVYDGTNWNLIGIAKDNNTTYSAATTSANGLMTSTMVTKLNGIEEGANKTVVENVLTSTSTINALSAAQGKVLNDTKANKATSLSGYGITDAYTKTQTDSAISAAVAGASHLKRSVVEALPTSGIDENTVYMILADDDSSDNKYIEWMYINSKWEKVGDSEVDLTGYIKAADLVALTDAEVDAICV